MSRGLGVGSMTVSITQRIEWDMGHRLGDGYPSKCRHAHGHRYVAEVSFTAPDLDRYGMVVDFGEVRDVVKGWIDSTLDHRMILSNRDPLLAVLQNAGEPLYVMDVNPTAENIAKLVFTVARERGVKVSEVRLWETSSSYATYSLPDAEKPGEDGPSVSQRDNA